MITVIGKVIQLKIVGLRNFIATIVTKREDRCKYKNSTWILNNARNQGNRQQRGSCNNVPTANVTNSSQSDINTIVAIDSSKSFHSLSAEQLQQLVYAISMMFQNHSPGYNNTDTNAAFLFSFSKVSINYVFTKP